VEVKKDEPVQERPDEVKADVVYVRQLPATPVQATPIAVVVAQALDAPASDPILFDAADEKPTNEKDADVILSGGPIATGPTMFGGGIGPVISAPFIPVVAQPGESAAPKE